LTTDGADGTDAFYPEKVSAIGWNRNCPHIVGLAGWSSFGTTPTETQLVGFRSVSRRPRSGKPLEASLREVAVEGKRLLKILWRMIQTRKLYDAELHARNQKQHGSWVLTLTTQKAG